MDAQSGVIQWYYGVREYDFYTVLFGIGRALGVMCNIIWDRALGYPIERPKSVTTAMLEEVAAKAAEAAGGQEVARPRLAASPGPAGRGDDAPFPGGSAGYSPVSLWSARILSSTGSFSRSAAQPGKSFGMSVRRTPISGSMPEAMSLRAIRMYSSCTIRL